MVAEENKFQKQSSDFYMCPVGCVYTLPQYKNKCKKKKNLNCNELRLAQATYEVSYKSGTQSENLSQNFLKGLVWYPTHSRLRQEDSPEFQDSPGYSASTRLASAKGTKNNKKVFKLKAHFGIMI